MLVSYSFEKIVRICNAIVKRKRAKFVQSPRTRNAVLFRCVSALTANTRELIEGFSEVEALINPISNRLLTVSSDTKLSAERAPFLGKFQIKVGFEDVGAIRFAS